MVAETQPLGTLGVDGKLITAQLVNFSVVVLVMWRWVYRPLVRMLDERSKKIEQGLKDAEAAAAARTSAQDEKSVLLDEARRNARAAVEEGRTAGEREREEMIRRAKAEVERVVAQGKLQLKNEKDKMVAEVKAEAAELVVAAVERVIGERLDAKKDEKLIRESLKRAETRI